MKMKIYKSLTTLPIYNNWMLSKSGDLRYLIAESREGDLPDIDSEKERELKQVYTNLILSKDKVEMRPIARYNEFLIATLVYSRKPSRKTEQNMNSAFGKYREVVQELFKVKDVEGFEGETIHEIYDNWKFGNLEKNKDFDLYFERTKAFDFTKLKIEQKGEYDLYSDILFVSQTLNMNIDEFTMSVAKFERFKNEAIRIANNMKNKQKK